MEPIDLQLQQLSERFSGVAVRSLPSGTRLVVVPDVQLPPGWSKGSTTIRFLVPPGYPYAALDCFWADPDLLLEGGRLPQNAATGNPVPETGDAGLWFSWHLAQPWNPNRDNLSSWMNTIAERMRCLQ